MLLDSSLPLFEDEAYFGAWRCGNGLACTHRWLAFETPERRSLSTRVRVHVRPNVWQLARQPAAAAAVAITAPAGEATLLAPTVAAAAATDRQQRQEQQQERAAL